MAVNMFFCYICTRPFRIQVYMIFFMYVLVRHAFPNKLDPSTSVFGELCRLVLKLWILTTPGAPWPLIAAVPQVDAGPSLTLGVVGAGLIYVHVYLTSIYLLKLYKIKAMIPVSTSFTTLLLYINWEGLTSPSIATPLPRPVLTPLIRENVSSKIAIFPAKSGSCLHFQVRTSQMKRKQTTNQRIWRVLI